MVGDNAQSIYSFRAATVRNILDFPQHYAGTTVIPLEQNYRSTGPILAATNQVIGLARESLRRISGRSGPAARGRSWPPVRMRTTRRTT